MPTLMRKHARALILSNDNSRLQPLCPRMPKLGQQLEHSAVHKQPVFVKLNLTPLHLLQSPLDVHDV